MPRHNMTAAVGCGGGGEGKNDGRGGGKKGREGICRGALSVSVLFRDGVFPAYRVRSESCDLSGFIAVVPVGTAGLNAPASARVGENKLRSSLKILIRSEKVELLASIET